MKELIISERTKNVRKSGKIASNSIVFEGNTGAALSLAVMSNRTKENGEKYPAEFFDCKVWAKKGEQLSPEILKLIGDNAFVTIEGYLSEDHYTNNNGEDVRKTVIIITDMVPQGAAYDTTFSGRIFLDPTTDEKGNTSFMVSQNNGKDSDGNYRPSTVVRCKLGKDADKSLIVKGNDVTVKGYLSSYKGTDNKTYVYLRAGVVELTKKYKYVYDENDMLVSKEPIDDLPE